MIWNKTGNLCHFHNYTHIFVSYKDVTKDIYIHINAYLHLYVCIKIADHISTYVKVYKIKTSWNILKQSNEVARKKEWLLWSITIMLLLLIIHK